MKVLRSTRHYIYKEVSPQRKDTMPYADYGEKVEFGSGSRFLKLKAKKDKVRFRLLGRPFIEGKHFIPKGMNEETGKMDWEITPCPRVNEKAECNYCTRYMRGIGTANKTKDKELIKKAHQELDKYNASISVYYPIINRLTQEFTVLQTTLGVRNKIEAEAEIGTRVLAVDFDLMRTEVPGSDYYKLSRVDSAETTPLTEAELALIEKNRGVKLDEIVNGSADDDSNVSFEANSEVREPEV